MTTKMEFNYIVMYDTEYFNMESNNLSKCIKYCKDSVKWNPELKGKYSIVLHNMTIATY